MEVQRRFLLFWSGQQHLDVFFTGNGLLLIGQLCIYHLELLRGEVIYWKILHGRQGWRRVFLLFGCSFVLLYRYIFGFVCGALCLCGL